MAISRNNPLTYGASGMLGGVLVFRSWNGKTFISNRPKKPTKESQQQRTNRDRFRLATAFAKNMMKDAAKKLEYQEKAKSLNLPNAYTAAITEYMRKPEIEAIDVISSQKRIEEIKIRVEKKGFDVGTVEVAIVDSEGKTAQTGNAKKVAGSNWSFKLQGTSGVDGPVKVIVSTSTKYGVPVKKEVVYNSGVGS